MLESRSKERKQGDGGGGEDILRSEMYVYGFVDDITKILLIQESVQSRLRNSV